MAKAEFEVLSLEVKAAWKLNVAVGADGRSGAVSAEVTLGW